MNILLRYKKTFFNIFIIFLLILIIDTISFHLGEDFNWDLRVFHFYNGYIYLNGSYIKDSLGYFLDPFCNSFYYLLIYNFNPLIVAFVISTIQSFSIILIFFLSMILFDDFIYSQRIIISFFIALSGIFGPIFISELGGTMNDVLLSCLIIASVLFCVKALNNINNNVNVKKIILFIILSGAMIGIASGLKLTNLIYLLSISFSFGIILFLSKNKTDVNKLFYFIIFIFSIFLFFTITLMPIGLQLWNNFRNPIFPFFNNLFKSPYYKTIAWHDNRWFPKSFLTYIEMPFLFMFQSPVWWRPNLSYWMGMEMPYRVFTFAAIALLLPFYFILKVKEYIKKKDIKNKEFLFLIFFFTTSFIIWQFEFSYYRYIATLEIMAPLILMLMLFSLFKKYNKFILYFCLLVVISISILGYPTDNWGRIKPFPENYFGLNKKTFKKFSNSLIIVGNQTGMPFNFVLPYFPSGDQFLFADSGINNKKYNKRYYSRIPRLLWKNKKAYFITNNLSIYKKKKYLLLSNYKFIIFYSRCEKINNPIKYSWLMAATFPLFICKVSFLN